MASLGGWLAALAVLGGVVLVALGLGRGRTGSLRSSSFAFAGGAVMGTQSALLAATVASFRTEGVAATFLQWQTYLLVVASIVGLLFIQSAYQAGPLATSMPVIDAVEPTAAILLGVLLFQESITGGTLARLVAAAGAAVVVAGIVLLDTSPVIQRLHEEEKGEEGRTEGQVSLRDEG